MGLRLIPWENLPLRGNKKLSKKEKLSIRERLKMKLMMEQIKRDDKIIQATCLQLFYFIDNEDKYNSKQIGDLVGKLQRTILSLQRKKDKLNQIKKKKTKN